MSFFAEYLEISPERIGIKGHRIGIEQIVRAYRGGSTAEDIARDFPGLPLESVYAALTYYLRNQEEIDVYIAALEQESQIAYEAWASAPPAVVRRLLERRAATSPSET